MDIEKQIIAYYENEYTHLAKLLSENVSWVTPSEAVQNALQRCYGIAMFVQDLGIKYEVIEAIYIDYKERMMNLILKEGE